MNKTNKHMAKVRGKVFQVWDGCNTNQLTKMLNDLNKGIIIVCPICSHVDINPYTHFSGCSSLREQERQLAQEYYD